MMKSSGLALSAGLVAWLVRGGAMLTWFLAYLPAWRHIDPIPILGMGQKEKDDRVRRAKEVGRLEAREHLGLEQILRSKM